MRPSRLISALLLIAMVVAGCAADVPRGDPTAGGALIAEVEPSCGLCHTLDAAGFSGSTAPNFDELQPGYQRVLDAMRNGPGFMPSYRNVLSEREMHHIAAFVSGEAGE